MATREVLLATRIQAPAAVVWDQIVQFDTWNLWSPMIPLVEGEAALGARLVVHIKLPLALGTVRLDTRVVVFEAGRELAWAGGVDGVARAHHSFRVEPIDEVSCRFVHSERFDSPAIALVWPVLGRVLARRYDATNEALKARAESLAAPVQRGG